eukprot:2371376-Rhodomonas_salina.1
MDRRGQGIPYACPEGHGRIFALYTHDRFLFAGSHSGRAGNGARRLRSESSCSRRESSCSRSA